MKKHYYYVIVASMAIIGMQSCNKKSDDLPTTTTNATFQLKNTDGTIVQSLTPGLIKAVHENLMLSKRDADAQTLYSQYDTITGYLKSLGKQNVEVADFKNEVIDSSKIIKADTSIVEKSTIFGLNQIYAQGYVQSIGFQGARLQMTTRALGSDINSFVGTINRSLRLEGFRFGLFDNNYYGAQIYYDIMDTNGNWNGTSYTTMWNQYVGTQGQNKAQSGLRIWFAANPNNPNLSNLHAFYIAHNESYGWETKWVGDGTVAGHAQKRLEAFAYQFLQY